MKTKRLFSVLILACLLPTVAIAVTWQDPETKVNYNYSTNGGYHAFVINSPDVSGNIQILRKISISGRDYPVTSIEGNAFRDCSNLFGVTIPESVTSIGSYAFYGCSSLASIIIPEGVKKIQNDTFRGCNSLTSITLPSTLTEIDNNAFYGCKCLAEVHISDVNAWCKVNFRSNPMNIPENHDCRLVLDGGNGNLMVPDGVTSIASRLFYGCTGLTSITIPESVVKIGNWAFEGCSNLSSITIAESNTAYDSRDNCNAIVETSSNTLINGCNNTVIPSSVTSIDYYAFKDCMGLTSITIPEGLTSIGDYAFAGCGGLNSITVEEGNTVYDSRENCNAIIETAKNKLIVGCNNTVIPESVTAIGYSAFLNCSGLTSVTIPAGVTNVKDAFWGCTGLTSVTINCSNVGSWFSWNESIKEIVIGEGVTGISDGAFRGCSGLTSISVADGNTVYDSRENCNAIIETAKNNLIAGCMNTVVPSSVKSIGPDAFYGCSGLTSVTFPEGLVSIGNYAFNGCTGLTSITIPSSLTSIDGNPFAECSGLTSIIVDPNNTKYDSHENCNAIIESNELISGCMNTVIPEDVSRIGYRAFCGCTGLTSIAIPKSVKGIWREAFEGCTGLTAVYIDDIATWCQIKQLSATGGLGLMTRRTEDNSDDAFSNISGEFGNAKEVADSYMQHSVTYKGLTWNPLSYAGHLFLNDKEVTQLVIPDSVTSISSGAFFGCTGITDVIIPLSVTDIGRCAFAGTTWYETKREVAQDGLCYIDNILMGFEGDAINMINETTYGSDYEKLIIYNAEGVRVFIQKYKPSDDIVVREGTKKMCAQAFKDCSNIKSLTIQDGLTSISKSAFQGCEALTSVTIPSSVTSIGNGAFYKCTNLDKVNISDLATWCAINFSLDTWNSDVSNPLYYAKHLFINGVEVTSLEIPEGVTGIGTNAFNNCTSLTSVTIPSSVNNVGGGAFNGCNRLASVTIPSSVNSVGVDAFNGCNSLTTVHINDLATWCEIEFGSYSANPLYYAKHFFLNGDEVKDLIIPESVDTIGKYIFLNCSGLTSVTIPQSVTNIGYEAFYGCSGLTSVTSLIREPFEISSGTFSYDTYNTATLNVLKGTKVKYEATDGWKKFKIIEEIGGMEPVKGDVNNDGDVNMSDINALQALISSGNTDATADLNGDGRVDIADVILLLKQVGGKE